MSQATAEAARQLKEREAAVDAHARQLQALEHELMAKQTKALADVDALEAKAKAGLEVQKKKVRQGNFINSNTWGVVCVLFPWVITTNWCA